MDVRKTATDASYIALGLALMGVQQAQARRRALRAQLDEAGECLTAQGRELHRQVREASGRAGDEVRSRLDRFQELSTELSSRIEPVVEQVQHQVTRLPERVVQAIEPVSARVRERLGTAAA